MAKGIPSNTPSRMTIRADIEQGQPVFDWLIEIMNEQIPGPVRAIGLPRRGFPGGEFAPGLIVLVTPAGDVEQVADDIAFPNGMAISPDGATLVVAESYANRLTAFDIGSDGVLSNRHVWTETPDDHPDGICMDAEGAVWYADVGNQRCVRIREGDEVLATVGFDRGAFACVLSRGRDPRLFVVGQAWGGPEPSQPSGRMVAFPAPAPGAGKP